jgi:hypothetical protein
VVCFVVFVFFVSEEPAFFLPFSAKTIILLLLLCPLQRTSFIFSLSVSLSLSMVVETQGLALAKQELHYLSQASSPFKLSLFFR